MFSLNSAPAATDAASQTELRWEHGASQVSGCRVCPALVPVRDGSSEHPCGRCAQGEELRRLVAEFREEVSRLRNIRESERETDYWNRTLPSLGQACQADRTHDTEDSLCSPHPLRHREQWQQVPAQRSRSISSVTPPPSQVPLHNRYEALQVEPKTRTMVHLGWRCCQG